MNHSIDGQRQLSEQMVYKDTLNSELKQDKPIIYADLANQAAVRQEIGDVLETFHKIITESLNEVNIRRAKDIVKYRMRSMFATDLNATIKAKIFKLLDKDPAFNGKVRVENNQGSPFFIVKDKYAVFIKKLNGKSNKPNSYPTPNSERTFNGELFVGLKGHVPFLFVGPNPDKGDGSYTTSLISRNDVNWTEETVNLFSYQDMPMIDIVEENKEITKVKEGRKKAIRKAN